MLCDMKTPFAGAEGMLPQTEVMLTIRNEKLSSMSYSSLNGFPFPSIVSDVFCMTCCNNARRNDRNVKDCRGIRQSIS